MHCSIEGCPNDQVFARGWCNSHWKAWRRYGDPLAGRRPALGTSPYEKVVFYGWTVTDSGCWEFDGGRTEAGYGTVGTGRRYYVHRVVYEHHHGAIPDGMVVRHACDNPPCCNPAHLSIGTQQDNAQDASRRGRVRNQYS